MAEIIRDRTYVFFLDDTGIEWEVADGRRGPDGRIWRCGVTLETAIVRDFFRYGEYFAGRRTVIERRRYRFQEGESRWFITADWARQLAASRPIATSADQPPLSRA